MSEADGRRIKRSIIIDMNSIKLCTKEMLERFYKIQSLKEYLDRKLKEIEEYNLKHNVDDSSIVNGRRLTNVGTYRAYMESYLKEHPMINHEMTFIVRQLAPSVEGLPIEIYVFSKDKVWQNYEALQADIFDHFLAVMPEFELDVYQNPTGSDFQKLS